MLKICKLQLRPIHKSWPSTLGRDWDIKLAMCYICLPLLHNVLVVPPIYQLKLCRLIILQFCRSEVGKQKNWIFHSQSHKVEIKVSIGCVYICSSETYSKFIHVLDNSVPYNCRTEAPVSLWKTTLCLLPQDPLHLQSLEVLNPSDTSNFICQEKPSPF